MTYTRDPKLAEYIDDVLVKNPIETEMIRKVIAELKGRGTPITSFYDGGERGTFTDPDYPGDFEILDVVFNLDEVYLYTAEGSMIFLVFGNDPDELFCDYSVDLDEILTPISDWATEEMNR